METSRIKWLTRVVYSQTFELCIAGIIFLNAVALALLTIPGIDAQTRQSLESFDQAALWIFVFELIVRMISYGSKPWNFFKTGWNVFDFVIIGLSPFLANQTLILRLLRIFRLIRIFRFLPEVRILTRSITRSLPPLMSMSANVFGLDNDADDVEIERFIVLVLASGPRCDRADRSFAARSSVDKYLSPPPPSYLAISR